MKLEPIPADDPGQGANILHFNVKPYFSLSVKWFFVMDVVFMFVNSSFIMNESLNHKGEWFGIGHWFALYYSFLIHYRIAMHIPHWHMDLFFEVNNFI